MDIPPTLFVCYTCGADKSVPKDARPGGDLVRLIDAADPPLPARVQKVKCLGGCNHPCAVAIAAPGKLTYLYGGLPVEAETVDQLRDYLTQYHAAHQGFVQKGDKPPLFRDVLARIPDANWTSETGIVSEPIDTPIKQAGHD
jgi:predicted metal-binding protein